MSRRLGPRLEFASMRLRVRLHAERNPLICGAVVSGKSTLVSDLDQGEVSVRVPHISGGERGNIAAELCLVGSTSDGARKGIHYSRWDYGRGMNPKKERVA